MIRLVVLSLLVFLHGLSARAEAPASPWVGGYPVLSTRAFNIMPDGGAIIAGSLLKPGTRKFTYLLLRVDRRGRLLWRRLIGTIEWPENPDVIALSDGGVALVGRTDYKPWLLRTDADGKTLWKRDLAAAGIDYALRMSRLPGGDVLVVGAAPAPVRGLALRRFDARGRTVWKASVAKGAELSVSALGIAADGAYVVAGTTTPEGGSKKRVWIGRLGKPGDRWTLILGPVVAKQDWVRDMAILGDGGVAALSTGDEVRSIIRVRRVGGDGRLLWDRRYDARDRENSRAIAALPDGGLALVGNGTGKTRWSTDIWVLRTDADGTPLWSRNYRNREQDNARAVRPDGHGGIVVLGKTACEPPGVAWLLRYPAALPRTAPAGQPAGLGVPRGCIENTLVELNWYFKRERAVDGQRHTVGSWVGGGLPAVDLVGPDWDLIRMSIVLPTGFGRVRIAGMENYLVYLAMPYSPDNRKWVSKTVPRLLKKGGEATRVSDGRIMTMRRDPTKGHISLTIKAMR